jgi:hypothetical protein
MKLYDAIPNHTKAFIFIKESLTNKEKTMLTEVGIASDAELEKLLKGIAKDLEAKHLTQNKSADDISLDAINSDDTIKEDVLNEGLILTLILASPTLLKLLGKLINWCYAKLILSPEETKQLAQYKKEFIEAEKNHDEEKMHELHDKIHSSKLGKVLSKFAHTAHEAFVWPIKKLLQGVAFLNGSKWLKENAEPVANLIYSILMIAVAGQGILHSIEGISGVKAAVTQLIGDAEKLTHITIDVTKGKDMTIDALKTILNKLLKA